MPEIITSYTPDGEWLYLVTNQDIHGSMIRIEPAGDDVSTDTLTEPAVYVSENVIDLDVAKGWAPLSRR